MHNLPPRDGRILTPGKAALGNEAVIDAPAVWREGVEPHFVHSGGHAWPEDLRRLASAIAAKQTVWVHRDSGDPSTRA